MYDVVSNMPLPNLSAITSTEELINAVVPKGPGYLSCSFYVFCARLRWWTCHLEASLVERPVISREVLHQQGHRAFL